MSEKDVPEIIEETVVQPPTRVAPWFIIVSVVVFVLIGVGVGGVVVYGQMHGDTVAKGLLVGDIPVGGMNQTETEQFVSDIVEKMLTTPMSVQAETPSGTISFSLEPVSLVGADGSAREFVTFDESSIVDRLMGYGKDGNRFEVGWNLLMIRFDQPQLVLADAVRVDTQGVQAMMRLELATYSEPAVDANIVITQTNPITVDITPSSEGVGYNYTEATEAVYTQYASFQVPNIVLEQGIEYPAIVADDLQAVTSTIETVLNQFPVQIVYTNTTTKRDTTWTIYPDRAATLIEPKRNGDIYIGIRSDAFLTYLDTIIAPEVEVTPKNARFAMTNGRVTEFQGAKNGISIATSTMMNMMNDLVVAFNKVDATVSTTVPLATVVAIPEISTNDVNDLGINELLGVGLSDFSGSPANRIGNIRNAVNKLNGLIVAPGEEFSTIEHTKPYTIAGGYLPEKVIKGDSLEAEIGGGLCQIGTTLFRMAMNSGLEITERRNHSLVVGYYNDLENGLPGTDATLYDPAPDFKFRNDTDHYILIEADMNVNTGMLTFSLWGTSDGRTASYTRPQVLEWYSPGEARYIETTNLPPGETECQSAFRGAYTSFTYQRQLPGEEDPQETVYTSRYRALPKICLIGVEEKTQCQELPDGSTSCSTEETGTPVTASSTPAA